MYCTEYLVLYCVMLLIKLMATNLFGLANLKLKFPLYGQNKPPKVKDPARIFVIFIDFIQFLQFLLFLTTRLH